MSFFLGLDTSNYTTSAAVYDASNNTVLQNKKLLPVKPGEKGLRQSDAVFHHTVQLPQILSQLPISDISGIGVSVKPRNSEGSYMPCFLCGEGTAGMLGHAMQVPVWKTSHQVGHILAALYSAEKLSWIREPFLAFHVSGGTTDCVLCEPDEALLLRITPVSCSLDLKAGQLVDRVGLMLGLEFPCGIELEKLAMQSTRTFRYKPTMKELDCCLSGLENQCQSAINNGEPPCDVAKRCLCAISDVLLEMTKRASAQIGDLPIVYAGGVMADLLIQEKLQNVKKSAFAKPAFSCDNAVGTAIYASLCNAGN
ncbi:MAG: peptidase M22 [Oscillospiraceae bacterium]|nr:peptidase M22 [Oscillospiraceae bacterium]MBR6616343.1 peptidase M22 [Oscillospiraceae bacterium]